MRASHSRGFGIQSPFAYHFVVDIVGDTQNYAVYQTLEEKYPEDRQAQLLHRFYFRMSKWLQVKTWVTTNFKSSDLAYIRAGFNESVLWSSNVRPDVVIMDLKNNDLDFYHVFFENILNLMSVDSVLIVENIHKDIRSYNFWKSIVYDHRTGLTFDLYDCGVVFFDLKKDKRNYRVMLR